MGEYLIRFLIGGLVVSAFSLMGTVLKPKTFAGLFAAAPSVALATLGMAISKQGGAYGAVEGQSMMIAAIALGGYSLLVAWLTDAKRWHALLSASVCLFVWFGIALGLWKLVLGGLQ